MTRPVRVPAERWTGEIVSTLEALLKAAGSVDAAMEARVLFAAIDGIAQHYALRPRHYPLDAVTAALVKRFT